MCSSSRKLKEKKKRSSPHPKPHSSEALERRLSLRRGTTGFFGPSAEAKGQHSPKPAQMGGMGMGIARLPFAQGSPQSPEIIIKKNKTNTTKQTNDNNNNKNKTLLSPANLTLLKTSLAGHAGPPDHWLPAGSQSLSHHRGFAALFLAAEVFYRYLYIYIYNI